MNPYETDRLLAEYLLFHYGSAREISGNTTFHFPSGALDFPAECVRFFGQLQPGTRALDVGCAVGRATFELTTTCSEVIGIDFSHSFIRAAAELKAAGRLAFQKSEEGAHCVPAQATLPGDVHPERARFEQGDAMDLRSDLGCFDYVLAANLLCRLPDPSRFISRLPQLVKPGGLLVVTTPCSWMEEYTPRHLWLADAQTSTFENLRQRLASSFEFQRVADLPFVIREHARKFQLVSAQATLWRRL